VLFKTFSVEIVDTETLEANLIPAGLITRVLSALILIPLVLAAVFYGAPWFDTLIVIGGFLLAWEWSRMCKNKLLWLVFGAVYIVLPCMALIEIRNDTVAGFETMVWLFVVVWSMDTGGYAFGVTIGGPKLAPRISPNKTWAGLIGGGVTSAVTGTAISYYLGFEHLFFICIVSAGVGILSQVGDLIESALKRHFGVKDSGNLIPGHGGVFDRVDGLMFAALVVAFAGAQGRGSILLW